MPGVRAEREGFLRTFAQRRPATGEDVAKAQPWQRVEHRHSRAAASRTGQHAFVAMLETLLVAEVQRGVTDVGHDVVVFHVGNSFQSR